MVDILVVDDHTIVRDGMKAMLSAVAGFNVVGLAASGEEALHFVKTTSVPDVVLCDIRLGDMNGIALFSRLRCLAPRLRAVFMAGMPNTSDEVHAKESGASAYLPKSVEMDDLIMAIRKAADGTADFISAQKRPGVASPLSFRETQILALLANGESKKTVAARLGITYETVKTYVRSIREKLGVSNTTAACACAVSNGYISI